MEWFLWKINIVSNFGGNVSRLIHEIFKTTSIYVKFCIQNPNTLKQFEDGIKRFILNGISGKQILLVTFEKTSTEFLIHQIFKRTSIYVQFSILNLKIKKLFKDCIKRYSLNDNPGKEVSLEFLRKYLLTINPPDIKKTSIYVKFSIKNSKILKLFKNGLKRFILNGDPGKQIPPETFEKTSSNFQPTGNSKRTLIDSKSQNFETETTLEDC